ncbi:hypothetical protein QWZ10_15565 [Paracoccus cavernae]|uniref:Uncharacterized protein n=1 Tax=Paracoccus cavernae TaxID=1571207 RepID=A0ABT8DBV7_9RHOB|nr:hypothetical protein [Paracoccus cavernae]
MVLPGYDPWQDASVWKMLDTRAEDHPQARFAPSSPSSGRRGIGPRPIPPPIRRATG